MAALGIGSNHPQGVMLGKNFKGGLVSRTSLPPMDRGHQVFGEQCIGHDGVSPSVCGDMTIKECWKMPFPDNPAVSVRHTDIVAVRSGRK